jgi:hypothetical protein
MKITKSELKKIIKGLIEEANEESFSDLSDRVIFKPSYDTSLGQMDFDDNFKTIDDHTTIYIDYGNLSGNLPELDDLIVDDSQKEKLVTELAEEEGYEEGDSDYNDLMQRDADDLFVELTNDVYDFGSVIDLLEHEDFPYETNIDAVVGVIETTGYSQGEYSKTYINIPEFVKATGSEWNDKLESELETIISRYMYDAPMFVRATIDGEEYSVEKLDNKYEEYNKLEYNKEEAIADIAGQYKGNIDKAELISYLTSIAPDTLEYI